MSQINPVFSFSVKPEEKNKLSEVAWLQSYSKKTGISFSTLVIRAISNLNKELRNDNA